ncbi:MAG: penicillin-binding transpeptidase domain-containing protein, partial [Streptosporangiaceae bacterium]
SIVVPAVRGDIVDDDGTALVRNNSELVISVNMMELSQQPDQTTVLDRLATLLGMSDTALADKVRLCTATVPAPCWSGSPYQPIPVSEHISDQVALQIMEQPKLYPDITAEVEAVVDYPETDGADPAQTLGYLQPITEAELKAMHLSDTDLATDEEVGQSGLEAQYDSALRGENGSEIVSVNADGDVTGTVSQIPPTDGDDLVTSLNSTLQDDVQNVLSQTISKEREAGKDVNQGAAIVETTTGRIVAMASYPDYNPNIWTNGISESEFKYLFDSSSGAPVINYVTQGEYAPGSTFKITSTAAAVDDGYSINGLYNCPSTFSIDGQSFANDGEPSLGPISFYEALVQSCDTVYYELAYDMWLKDNNKANYVASATGPVQKMQQMELDWGFGKDTGIDLPEQSTGTIPTRQWLYWLWEDNAHGGQDWCKYGNANGSYVQQIEYQDCQDGYVWEPGQAAIAAIGQGYVTATPLQLADAYVALANGGTVYEPRVGEALVSPSGSVVERINPPVADHLPVSQYTLAYIRNALAGVVTSGTAAGAFGGFPLNKVCVAGKTGTAQNFGKNSTSVFASFAPCNHPKYVVIVMIPNSGYGADFAAPAVRAIWDDIYGLEGHKAAFPGGQYPTTIPKVTS